MNKWKGVVIAILFFLLLPGILQITTALEDAAVTMGMTGINGVIMSWFSFAVIACFIIGVFMKFRGKGGDGGDK